MRTYPAIALTEFDSISMGMYAGDSMLKQSPVTVLKSGSVHNGKYLFLIGGSVAAVSEAYDKGMKIGGEHILDAVHLPDIHPQLHDAILGQRFTCPQEALGIIETSTVSSAISAADAALKATGVDLVELRLADDLGGKALVILSGKIETISWAIQLMREKTMAGKTWLHDAVIPNLDSGMKTQIEQSTRFSAAKLIDLETGEI